MRNVVLAIVAVFSAVAVARADDKPFGTVLELHSCEVYAGGCVVSSQATLEGRYLLRLWDFKGGGFNNTQLQGLKIAALQCSSENFAAAVGLPTETKTVIYFPKEATTTQREALLGWLKTTDQGFKSAQLEVRAVPLQVTSTSSGYIFQAGENVSLTTVSLESCGTGSCGEALWYTPRTATTAFAVAVNKSSRVTEPMLGLNWRDAGKRSVFLGRFGPEEHKPVYVTANDLCSAGTSLF